MAPNTLVAGRTYFHLTFADAQQTMPSVQPMVYLGLIATDDEQGPLEHAFQDTVSYMRFGSALTATQGHEEMEVFCMSTDELAQAMFEIGEVAQLIATAAQRAAALGFPALPVLGR